MQNVPIRPLASQQVQCQLGGQACTFNIYQQAFGLYIDVYVGQTLIIAGVIALNLNRIVRSAYLGFVGDLTFYDTQQAGADPVFTGLGSRYLLIYLETTDDVVSFAGVVGAN